MREKADDVRRQDREESNNISLLNKKSKVFHLPIESVKINDAFATKLNIFFYKTNLLSLLFFGNI